jgi:carbon storage regulator
MLVLARKQGQTIVIDDRIKITVLKVKGSAVRVGIDAPDEVSIRRGELEPLRVTAENHAA